MVYGSEGLGFEDMLMGALPRQHFIGAMPGRLPVSGISNLIVAIHSENTLEASYIKMNQKEKKRRIVTVGTITKGDQKVYDAEMSN